MIGPTSAIEAPATTTCPNAVDVSPASLRIGRITPSPVAERMIATSNGDLTRSPARSPRPTRIAMPNETA